MWQRVNRTWAAALVGVLVVPAAAATLTVRDVADLLRMGFGEDEIRVEIERTGSAFHLTPADEQLLRQAGAPATLIEFMRQKGGQRPPRPDATPGPKEPGPARVAPEPSGRRPMPAGWQRHVSPRGFVVGLPPGWQVQEAGGDMVVVQGPQRTARVAILPFFLKAAATAQAVVQQAPQVLGPVYGGARIVQVRRVRPRPDEVVASMTYQAEGEPGEGRVLCSIEDRSGMCFAIGAPRSQFPDLKPVMATVLKSFSFTQPTEPVRADAAGPPDLAYGRFVDPRENAFSVEVPQGWQTAGGLVRRSAVQIQAVLSTVSPDGLVRLSFGDADIPTFTTPTPMLAMAGFHEGSWYSPGYGVRHLVRRLVPPPAFAQEYLATKAARGLANLRFVDVRDRPELVQELNAIYSRLGAGVVQMRMLAGEASCTGERDGRPWAGYCFVGIRASGGDFGCLWQVEHLIAVLASQEKTALARAVLDHMLRSVQINPHWAQAQSQLTANVSRIVSETHAAITKTINDSYWSRQRVMDDLSRKWSNMILGQTDVRDPTTGEQWKVASGHNYYWRKGHTDVIVGTDTYTRPDIDFEPILEW